MGSCSLFLARPQLGVLSNLPAPTASVVSTLLSPPSLLALRCPSPTDATSDREIWGHLHFSHQLKQKNTFSYNLNSIKIYIRYKALSSILYCTAESGLKVSLFFKPLYWGHIKVSHMTNRWHNRPKNISSISFHLWGTECMMKKIHPHSFTIWNVAHLVLDWGFIAIQNTGVV